MAEVPMTVSAHLFKPGESVEETVKSMMGYYAENGN